MRPYITHEEATIDAFRRNPGLAAAYLNAVLADGTYEELASVARRVAKAFEAPSQPK
ncbi:MAG: hypothetical protein LBR38_06310 [Synergistaceae bacterium]|nr:hypothetical protein [Synergistaceae bacterium]